MFGLLNLNKPSGESSRDTVNQIQRLVRPVKSGHCGTLDPLANGVLIVCLGPATRLADYVQQMPKTYIGSFRLGCESPSEDIETEVRQLDNPAVVSRQQLESALDGFRGKLQQMPPKYSALKVKGKRAYQLARQGKQVQLQPRTIEIYQLKLIEFSYPDFTLEIQCSAGTYVRSLGRDIGRSMNSGAVMTELTRSAIGTLKIGDSVDPHELTSESIRENILSPALALTRLPKIELSTQQQNELSFGRSLKLPVLNQPPEMVAVNSDGELLAVLSIRKDGQFGPKINFVAR